MAIEEDQKKRKNFFCDSVAMSIATGTGEIHPHVVPISVVGLLSGTEVKVHHQH